MLTPSWVVHCVVNNNGSEWPSPLYAAIQSICGSLSHSGKKVTSVHLLLKARRRNEWLHFLQFKTDFKVEIVCLNLHISICRNFLVICTLKMEASTFLCKDTVNLNEAHLNNSRNTDVAYPLIVTCATMKSAWAARGSNDLWFCYLSSPFQFELVFI